MAASKASRLDRAADARRRGRARPAPNRSRAPRAAPSEAAEAAAIDGGSTTTWKSFAANEVTHSAAHYLVTLLRLRDRNGYARVADVARALDIAKGSVSVQMRHLREKGLVVEDESRFLRLSEAGETIARKVVHNRRVLVRFIHGILGIPQEHAEVDACKIEHLLSTETCHKVLSLVHYLTSDAPPAKRFRSEFRRHRIECPSIESCNLCSAECLAEGDQEVRGRDRGGRK